MAAMKASTRAVFDYIKAHNDEDMTSADIGEVLDLQKRQVDGIFTSFQKKGWGIRVPSEIENADGSHTKVKFLHFTDIGMAYDPDTDEE